MVCDTSTTFERFPMTIFIFLFDLFSFGGVHKGLDTLDPLFVDAS